MKLLNDDSKANVLNGLAR